jgi:hypothetical protein
MVGSTINNLSVSSDLPFVPYSQTNKGGNDILNLDWNAYLVAENKRFVSESKTSEEETEKRVADARKEFMKKRLQMLSAGASSSASTRDTAQQMQGLMALLGEGQGVVPSGGADVGAQLGGDVSASLALDGFGSASANAMLQGDVNAINFQSLLNKN